MTDLADDRAFLERRRGAATRPVSLREFRTRPRCATCQRGLSAGGVGGWSRRPRLVWCDGCALGVDLLRSVAG